jgi:pSer/pThr/pTyr-binding forkhead associated (FHA) protein
VRFSNYEVSRRHAIVVWRTEQATITDLGSSNGTMLNGDRLGAKPAPLIPGTVVSFGNLGFTYRMVA